MSVAATRTIPAGGVSCVSQGRCGETTGWHHQGSDAHKRCIRAAGSLTAATDRMRDAVTAGKQRSDSDDEGRRPLRRLEHDEEEILESMRQTALRFLPFYSHMLYKVKPLAVDEDPKIDQEGNPQFAMRAGITKDWRLLINYEWVRHEFETSYEQYGDMIRQGLRDADVPESEESVRAGSDMMTNLNMAKVLLHEMGHAMYNTWDLPEKEGLDHDSLNRAEDAVINNALRVLGAKASVAMPNENFHGEFLENAVYGGTVKCDDPDHSWHYEDPDDPSKSGRRCSYDETTAHYYAAIEKQKEEQQQGSSGDDEGEEGEAAPQDGQGQDQGRAGGSDRDGDAGGEAPDPSDESSQGSGGSPGSEGDESNGCGRKEAEKYADDPLSKGDVSDAAKETALDVTAGELDQWAENNEARAKSAGFGAASMARKWAKHRRKSDGIRWNSVLDRKVRRTIESKKQTRDTYSSPHRRNTGGLGTIRRGVKSGYMPRIAAAIDTSGSMNDQDIFMAYNSIRSVIKRTGITSLDAFAVDSEAKTKPVKIKKAEDVARLLKGGGGTDMCAGITVAANNGNDVCVVFTDGEVPWGEMASRPRHVRGMEVVIGVIAEGDEECQRLSDKVPDWMQTVKIDKKLLAEKRNGRDHNDTFIG